MNAYDAGLLVLRLCLGLTMAAHGYNKSPHPVAWRARPRGSTVWV